MSHPAYKPSPAFCTKAKVAKGGGGGGVFTGHYGTPFYLYVLAALYNFTSTI